MAKNARNRVIGPDGRPLTLLELPSPNTGRWVIRKKAEVVAAVDGGLLSLDEACKMYAMATEEFFSWKAAVSHFGLPGLRVTHAHEYRQVGQESRHQLN
jgi:hypothetical protein